LPATRFLILTTMKNEPQELRELLSRLPDAPVASNFTARVMQAIELEEMKAARARNPVWFWRVVVPRVGVAATVILFAGVAIQHHELNAQRAVLAQNVALVVAAQPLPSVEALKNFDAIQRMGQPQHADEELLALLQ
jgi:negative regulator of sigma E activity